MALQHLDIARQTKRMRVTRVTMTMTLACAAIIVSSTPIRAQTLAQSPQQAEARSHWGVAGALTPQWQFLDFLEDSMDKIIEMTGSELRVGIVRGKQLGGEWGVSYVKRYIDDESTILQEKPKCVVVTGQAVVCAGGNTYRTSGAFMNGVQLHRFFPVATIARRVQIGAVLTGGVARVEGHAAETQEHLQMTVNPTTGVSTVSIAAETHSVEARSIFSHTFVAEYMPIGGLEAAVAVLVAPGVKLRVSGGAAFPGFHTVSLSAQYLFGSK